MDLHIEEIGVQILFLPIVIVISLVVIGLILFAAVQILSLFIRIPVSLFNRSIGDREKNSEGPKGVKTKIEKFDSQELWIQFRGGGWIIWVAIIPLFLILLSVINYLLTLTF
jgi:hypothetical protein